MNFFRNYFNARVLSFAIAQGVVLVATLLRLRIISDNSSLGTFALFILFIAILGASPLFFGGQVNKARIQFLENPKVALELSKSRLSMTLVLGLAGVYVVQFFLLDLPVIGGLALILMTCIVISRLSPYYGAQQGLGNLVQQNYSQAIAAIVSMILVFVFVTSPSWANISETQKLNLLAASASLASLIPYTYARMAQRGLGRTIAKNSHTNRKSRVTSLSELTATLPPAALTAIDAIALQLLSSPYQLALYGVTQRASLIGTFMTGANYVKDANDIYSMGKSTTRAALRSILRLNLLNAPFLILFVCAAPFLVEFMSADKLGVDWVLIVAYLFLAVLQPAWVVVSNLIFQDHSLTLKLGRSVLLFVLPSSIATTLIGGALFGSSGVVFATVFSYIIAIGIASKKYWK
jgi:hypothetical protein